MTPESIPAHHLKALGQSDIDAILTDYAEDAIIFFAAQDHSWTRRHQNRV